MFDVQLTRHPPPKTPHANHPPPHAPLPHPPPPPTRKLEVIGHSIPCGYGNESKSEKIHFLPKDENALETYGALAAGDLNAQYLCIAWSGRKMSPNFTLPEIYDLAIPTDK